MCAAPVSLSQEVHVKYGTVSPVDVGHGYVSMSKEWHWGEQEMGYEQRTELESDWSVEWGWWYAKSRNGDIVLLNKVLSLPKDNENRSDQTFVAFYESKKTDFHQVMPVLPSLWGSIMSLNPVCFFGQFCILGSIFCCNNIKMEIAELDPAKMITIAGSW